MCETPESTTVDHSLHFTNFFINICFQPGESLYSFDVTAFKLHINKHFLKLENTLAKYYPCYIILNKKNGYHNSL